MEAIEKKTYKQIVDDKSGLRALYQYWLKDNGGRSLFTFLNRYARIDGLLQSGSSTVNIEYKKRTFSVSKYRDGFMLEREKFENLKKASALHDCPSVYICDFTDAFVIHHIQNEENYIWQRMMLPSDQHKNILVEKEITIIPFANCDFIVGKKTWQRSSLHQLETYFKRIDNESY